MSGNNISFLAKSVENKDFPVQIIHALESAYRDHSADDKTFTENHKEDTPGVAGHIRRFYTRITGKEAGGHYLDFPEIKNLKLEEGPYVLYTSYKNFLQDVLFKDVKEPVGPLVRNKVIGNKFVLIYEALTRLAALALCNDNYQERDGLFIKNVIDSFVINLRELPDQVLKKTNWM